MSEILWFVVGLVVGVVYHAVLQPYVAAAWAWLKAKLGAARPHPNGE